MFDQNRTESVLYFGLSTEFLVTNLASHTAYQFSLEVCNRIGCSRSGRVEFTTREMVPISVSVPEVVSIETNSIILKWSKPTSEQLVNGILNKYILYINNMDSDLGVTSIDCAATIHVKILASIDRNRVLF